MKKRYLGLFHIDFQDRKRIKFFLFILNLMRESRVTMSLCHNGINLNAKITFPTAMNSIVTS